MSRRPARPVMCLAEWLVLARPEDGTEVRAFGPGISEECETHDGRRDVTR